MGKLRMIAELMQARRGIGEPDAIDPDALKLRIPGFVDRQPVQPVRDDGEWVGQYCGDSWDGLVMGYIAGKIL